MPVAHCVGRMNRTILWSCVIGLLGLAGLARVPAQSAPPDFQEVYGLVRSELKSADPAEMNRAALEGLLQGLNGKVLLTDREQVVIPEKSVAKVALLEDGVGYVRLGLIEADSTQELTEALTALSATNTLKGLVLDLRFALGKDYRAVAAVAGLFLSREQPLLDWGEGVVKSKPNAAAFTPPLAVLVNRETQGAAEALAGVLRQTGVALVLGGTTAGSALVYREYLLKTGQKLLIGSDAVKLADGEPLPATGVIPDINVDVKPEVERSFLDDPYGAKTTVGAGNAGAGTVGRRPRISEADLVRERREGTNLLEVPSVRDREPQKPRIEDPALARAVDVLKGLAVVRRSLSR